MATFKHAGIVCPHVARKGNMKRVLTDRLLKSLKARPQRFEIMDSVVRGMGIRVSERGVRPFILIARYPGSRNPTRRALGEYPAMSLEKAREKAGHLIW